MNLLTARNFVKHSKMENSVKQCKDCQKLLPNSSFTVHRSRPKADGSRRIKLRSRCRKCAYLRLRGKFNLALYQIRKWRRVYGLNPKQVEALFRIFTKCPICGKKATRLQIDHCHRTGKVRGLLCARCNRALGQFGDSIKGLMKAVNYLKGMDNVQERLTRY